MATSTILSDNGVSSGTSGIKTSGGNDGTLVLQTTTAGGAATTALTIDTGQRTKFPTTIGVGDATPSTSGSGISFPATQSASSDANTLDDYEEGTWTPTLLGSTTNPTQSYLTSATVGRYTKIGNLVTLSFRVHMATSGVSGGTGTAQIGGLPFAAANVNNLLQGTGIGSCSSWATTNTGAPTNMIVNNNSTTLIDLSTYQNDAGKVGGLTGTNAADITNSTNLSGTIVYLTS